jgi:hypothetical protein
MLELGEVRLMPAKHVVRRLVEGAMGDRRGKGVRGLSQRMLRRCVVIQGGFSVIPVAGDSLSRRDWVSWEYLGVGGGPEGKSLQ